ncbi:MAG: hypothetical protein ACJAQT_003416 [Akkermansiaceae bacterium]|jgi:hypothetical protein
MAVLWRKSQEEEAPHDDGFVSAGLLFEAPATFSDDSKVPSPERDSFCALRQEAPS